MKIRSFIKLIFFVSSLINLSLSAKPIESFTIEKKNSSQIKNINLFKKVVPDYIKDYRNISSQRLKNNYSSSKDDFFQFTRNHSPLLLANLSDTKKELEIQSDIQYEENNILNAEGNVIVFYKGNILKADSLIYDKTKKTVIAKGNVSLSIGRQLLNMSSFQYDFDKKKGYLIDVKGLIKTDNLIYDLMSDSETSNTKEIDILEEIKKEQVLNTPGKVDNWVLSTDKIEIDGDKWISKKAIFTNDLLELNQVKLKVNRLEAISNKEELRFKSSLSYLILDEKIQIPFLFVERTLTKSRENFRFENRWNSGFDKTDKDGAFIGRKLKNINLFNDFMLDLETQFLIQRSIKGYTKSFVKRGASITADKVKRDTSLADYFALRSKIKGKLKNWDFKIDKEINSFDFDKLLGALRVKSYLSKEITFLNSKWDKSIFGVYRDRIWNGSMGEAEIYTGYGSKLEKQNTWEVNGIVKTENISFGLANLRGESLNNKDLVSSLKGNLFYSLNQKFPIRVKNIEKKFIDDSYKYIPEPIKKGISLNTKIELLYSLYEYGNSQGFVGFGVGPEIIFGNFKNKYFDYTKISVLSFYKIADGESIFKFDQISDQFTLNFEFDQQLFGPLIIKSSSTVNLDNDSNDYGDFINSKISLNWKKRSYEFGIFYQPHNESGGINFTLFGFE